MDQELERLVLEVLAKQLPPGFANTALSRDVGLLDVGLDSLNMMSFWVALERMGPPGLDIGTLDFGATETVGDVLAHADLLWKSHSETA